MAKEIYVYNSQDRNVIPGVVLLYPLSSDGMAFSLAGRLGANGDPTKPDRPTGLEEEKVIIDVALDRDPAGHRPIRYGEVFDLLTARGVLVSMGHTSDIEDGAEIALNGEITGDANAPRRLYTSFAPKTAASDLEDAVLDIPVEGLHGLDIDLRHCFTARKGRIQDKSLLDSLWETLNPLNTVSTAKVTGNTHVFGFRAVAELDAPTLPQAELDRIVADLNAQATNDGFPARLSDPVMDRAVHRYDVFDRFERLEAEFQQVSGAVRIGRITYSFDRHASDPVIREGR
jgi:hypothetical protein